MDKINHYRLYLTKECEIYFDLYKNCVKDRTDHTKYTICTQYELAYCKCLKNINNNIYLKYYVKNE